MKLLEKINVSPSVLIRWFKLTESIEYAPAFKDVEFKQAIFLPNGDIEVNSVVQLTIPKNSWKYKADGEPNVG